MKKKFLLLFLGLLISAATYAVADVLDFSASVYFPKVSIVHTAINTVSPQTRILKPKISVDFANYTSATARVLYYIDDASSNILSAPDKELTIYNKSDFYIELPKLEDGNTSVSYRIRVIAKNDEGHSEEIFYPEAETAADLYIKAVLTASASSEVTSSEGGKVEYNDGDQEHSSSTVTFDPGSVEGSGQIGIEEISLDDFFNSLFPVSSLVQSSSVKAAKSVATADLDKNKMVKLFNVFSIGSVTINTQGYAEFSYGDSTATKFDILFSKDGKTWEYVKVTKIDTKNKVVCCAIKDFGYYLIMVSSNLNDNDYRPAKRARVKARIASGKYEGFRFSNLVDGDTVKIYNLNGKKIAELTAGDKSGFVWQGRKGTNNSGDWAESGTYVYQINVKEKGKIISGTIAFVW